MSPTPLRAEVAAELQRVLASRCFEQSDRAKEFLRFVVTETLAGRGDRLKGYTIGVEVFGRPPDFNAQSDALVRVEAGRVRGRLVEYYATEGASNPVRIVLTRGGYMPQFTRREATRNAPAAPLDPPQRRSPPFVLAAATLMVALVSLALWRAFEPAPTPPEQTAATGPPKVLVLPFANSSDDAAFDYFAHGITEELTLRLADFEVLVLVRPRNTLDAAPADAIPPFAGADYVLAGSVRKSADRVHLSVRLLAADSGAQLWTDAFDETAKVATLLAFQERVAEHVSSTVTRPLGPIFRQEVARATRTPPEYLDTYDCVLKLRYYRLTFAARDHGPAVTCFRAAVVREPDLADAWAGLALLYLDEHLYGYSAEQGAIDAMTRAREAARKAIEIDEPGRLANLALAKARFHDGDLAGFERAADQLLTERPRYPEHLITIGTLFVIMGEPERGLALVDEAMAFYAPDRPPGLYFIAHALEALASGDYDRAVEQALRIDAPDWALGSMVVAACAALAGQPEIAQRAIERLLELNPTFPLHAREQLRKWQPDEALFAHIVEGLEAAGLDLP